MIVMSGCLQTEIFRNEEGDLVIHQIDPNNDRCIVIPRDRLKWFSAAVAQEILEDQGAAEPEVSYCPNKP